MRSKIQQWLYLLFLRLGGIWYKYAKVGNNKKGSTLFFTNIEPKEIKELKNNDTRK